MKSAISVLLFSAVIFAQDSAPAARPADQSYVLDAQPKVTPIPPELLLCEPQTGAEKVPCNSTSAKPPAAGSQPGVKDTRAPEDLPQSDVRALVDAAMGAHGAQRRNDTYYLVHLLQHEDGKPGSTRDAWYVYFCEWDPACASRSGGAAASLGWRMKLNTPNWKTQYALARLFGARKASMIYIHYNVPTGELAPVGEKIARDARQPIDEVNAAMRAAAERVAKAQPLLAPLEFLEAVENAANEGAPENVQSQITAIIQEARGRIWRAQATGEKPNAQQVLREAGESLAAAAASAAVEAERQDIQQNSRGPNGGELMRAPGGDGETQVIETSFLPITYTIDITKKTPVILDNLKAVAEQLVPMGEAQKRSLSAVRYQALIGVQLDMRIDHPTSTIAVAGQRGQSRTSIGSKEFDNERRYPVDFGFAVPISKVKELKFEGGAVAPKPVEKANIYGTVSVFLFGPVDTKADKAWFRSPQLLYGMALSDKPWDNHLFALGFLTKYVQPFVGLTLSNKQVSEPGPGTTGLKWSAKIAYGVQIPVGTISKAIKPAAGK